MPTVYIIIVNWNGWQDTIECLESVFRMRYQNFRVVVCDNGSGDDSVPRLTDWATGTLRAQSPSSQLKSLSEPPVDKPIPFAIIDPECHTDFRGFENRLFIVPIGKNLGFAGANNVALRLAMATGDLSYAWLLNNDTVVDPQALTHLLARMEQDDAPGMCGSTVIYYSDAHSVQALGGARYDRWTARTQHIGTDCSLLQLPDPARVELQMDYVLGASMLIGSPFLETIGLMNENYFLFFEEVDWCTRARKKFKLGYSPESIVFHKQGRSTGEDHFRKAKLSRVAAYYGPRNRVLFTRIHHPAALLTVLSALAVSILRRLATGQFATVKVLFSGIVHGMLEPIGRPVELQNEKS